MRKFGILLIALMLLQSSCFVGIVGATSPDPTPFVDGDRVMFVGDSITHYGLYHMYIMEYYATRYPERNIQFINDGIAGDSAAGVLSRIDADIAANNPTKVVMMIGMNDFSRTSTTLYPPTSANEAGRVALLDSYESRVSQIVDKIKGAGIEVVLLTPSPYDETMLPLTSGENVIGYNAMLSEAGTRLKNVASAKNVPVIDFNTDMTQINNTLQASSPTSTIIGSDRIHPLQNGHNLMAYLFLKAQGFSGIVSDVEINYATGLVVKSTNANIANVAKVGSVLQYQYTPLSLPILADGYYNTVSGWGANIDELNQELLKVTGVPAGSYRVKMDGVTVGQYSESQIASGINLATLANNPEKTKLTAIRTKSEDKYNTEIKLRDLAFTLWMMSIYGYSDINVYKADKYGSMNEFNQIRLNNAVYAYSNTELIKTQIAEKEAALKTAASPALIEMELTDQADVTPSPAPTPDASKSILYESFDSFPVQEYTLPASQNGWNMSSGEATTAKMQAIEENGNKYFKMSRISAPTANNSPIMEKSFTAQTGIFTVEADLKYPAGTEQVYIRLTGANNNAGGRGWVPAVGINLSSAGAFSAFNQLDGAGTGSIASGLDATAFQHMKVEVNVPKNVFKVYVNGSSTAVTNPRAIPSPNTKGRTADEWDFRESGNVIWSNINKVDVCLANSTTVGSTGAVDNVWVYDQYTYYGTTPAPTTVPTATPVSTPTPTPTVTPATTPTSTSTITASPGETPDPSKVILYDDFQTYTAQTYAMGTPIGAWSLSCSAEAATTESAIVNELGNQFMTLKRKTVSTANNMPMAARSITPQTGRFIVEADMRTIAATGDVIYLRLTGANNSSARSWVPPVGISLSPAGALVAFNDPSGTGSVTAASGLAGNTFHHIKLDVNITTQSFRIYLNRSLSALVNTSTGGRDWPFRESGSITWSNINKIDFCLSSAALFEAGVDNVLIYDPSVYTPPAVDDVIFSDKFDQYTAGAPQAPWSNASSAGASASIVDNAPANTGKAMKLSTASGATSVIQAVGKNTVAFATQTGKFNVRSRVYVPSTSQKGLQLRLWSPSYSFPYAVGVVASTTGSVLAITDPSGLNPSAAYTKDAWNTIEVEVDISNQRYRFKVNDGTYGAYAAFRPNASGSPQTSISMIDFADEASNKTSELYIDDVYIYKTMQTVLPDMEMSVAGFVVDGDEFNTANVVTKAGDAKINMLLTNNLESAVTPVVITAVYNGNKLAALTKKEIPIGSGKIASTELSVTIPDQILDGSVKVMFLSDTINLKPYMAPYTIPLKIANELRMPNVFTSNMVLQRNEPINVFGEAPSDAQVTISFNGKQTSTTAHNGRFIAALPQEGASFDGKDLTVTAVKGSYNKTLTYTNVVVGDVLYASGQSNMQMAISGLNITPTTVPENFRLFTVSNVKDMYTRVNNPGSLGESWKLINTGSDARASSAVMYYIVEFMRNNGVTDAPIGVIQCSWGGTSIESWYSYDAFNNSTDATLNNVYNRYMNNIELGSQKIKTARLYYSMVRSVMPYTIKSVVWYQGESDVGYAYDVMLKKFIEDYRVKWGISSLPCFVVQLPGYTQPSWPSFRLKQWAVTKTTPYTYVGITNDTGNPADIHPTDKSVVGERMARLMMNKLWSIDIPYSGPVYKSKTINANQITLSFDYVSDGLHGALGSMNTDGTLPGFEIAGSDGVCKAATATIVGDTVVVSSTQVASPVNVRYAYTDIPFKSLCNVTGQLKLPCGPFRTDGLY